MSFDYVRKIVSGNKARYVDGDSNLDLVYGKRRLSLQADLVTDRILM